MKKFAKKTSGFSLIEIMIAMAIMALIGAAALKLFNVASSSTHNIRENGDRLNDVSRAFLFISNDMQQLSTRRVRDEYGDRTASMKSDLQSSTPYISLTRLGRRNPAQLPRSNLEHLVYTIEDKVLIRSSYTYADGMPENMALKRPILKNVEDMKIEFYDGEQWNGYWPLSDDPEDPAANALPVAVKFKLELTDYGVIERLYSISDKVDAESADEERR